MNKKATVKSCILYEQGFQALGVTKTRRTRLKKEFIRNSSQATSGLVLTMRSTEKEPAATPTTTTESSLTESLQDGEPGFFSPSYRILGYELPACEQSCEGRCGFRFHVTNGGCFCDDYCEMYGDCCIDYYLHCKASPFPNGTVTVGHAWPTTDDLAAMTPETGHGCTGDALETTAGSTHCISSTQMYETHQHVRS